MNQELFLSLVKQIEVGKQLPDAIYLHKDAFSSLPEQLISFVRKGVEAQPRISELVKQLFVFLNTSVEDSF